MNIPSYLDIINSIPDRFRADKSIGYATIFHIDITDGDAYTVIINQGICSVEKGLQQEPKCTIKAEGTTYVKLELRQINPQMALMTGKVKVSNISEMIQFSKLFRKFKLETDESQNMTNRKPKTGPLVGLRILDFTRLLPGPMATMMMADMGAEVIKVEDPDSPDYIRSFSPMAGKESAFYMALNRSKRSLAINYRSEEGRAIIHQLVKSTDIFIEQFRPGVMKHFGLGYEDIKRINPKIIYVSITGYGQDGPYANRAGHDLNYIGYSSLLGTTGNAEAGPIIPGGQTADIAGGAYMAMNACLAAVFARNKTDKGQHVDVSMLDCVIPLNTLQIAQQYSDVGAANIGEFGLSGGAANYNVYECADGKYIALGTLEPKFWEPFCDLVNKPEWKPRIIDTDEQMKQLKDEVAQLFQTKTQQDWLQLTEPLNNCISPVLSLNELEEDPQIKHRNMIVNHNDGFKSPGIPLKFSDTKPEISWDAPKLGEDNAAILKELKSIKV